MYLTTVALVSFLLAPPEQPAPLGEVPNNLPSVGHTNAPPNGQPARLQPIPEPDLGSVRDVVAPEKKVPAGLPSMTRPEPHAAPRGTASPSEPDGQRLTPPELVAEALKLPPGSKLTGRPFELLTAISSAAHRRQQLDATVAYWRLVEAVAAYRFAFDHHDRLLQIQDRAGEALLLRTARASSAARLREAEVAAITAQHELAALVLLPADTPLPLPADPPHVGPYRTHFNELFATGGPLARARLIDRTLPIRRQAIEDRASAVQAAAAAEAAAVAAYGQGRSDLESVLAAAERCLREREAFMASVCQYNCDIADYVLAVVGPGTNGPALLRMLITPTRDAVRPLATGEDPAVQPAGYDEPVPTPARRPEKNVPTPAKRPEKNVPTPAKRPDSPDAPQTGAPTPWTAKRPVAEVQPPPETPVKP